MRNWTVITLSTLAVWATVTGGCAQHRYSVGEILPANTHREIPRVTWTLELTGSGLGRPTVLTFEQLGRKELIQLDNVFFDRTNKPDIITSWRGVSLNALLQEAQIKPGPMHISMEGSDGYRIRNTRRNLKDSLVALQDAEDRWLAQVDSENPLRLIVPGQEGKYWVANVCRIKVEPISGSGTAG